MNLKYHAHRVVAFEFCKNEKKKNSKKYETAKQCCNINWKPIYKMYAMYGVKMQWMAESILLRCENSMR